LRKYFRVNTTTEITASYKSSSQAASQSSWSIDGHTMDLSASGVLCLFSDEPKHNEHIILEIYLPHKNLTVNAVSHVVHKKRLRNRRWLVAFHFDTVSAKHRDAIITYLLSEQRKQLRENVQTQDF
jgi:c-di-GMP-binding flagellar brake protein YcgR